METFAEHYGAMCAAILNRMPGADMELIDRAVAYARNKHKDQKRKDASPYIIHPLAVAQIVTEMGLDTDAILGAVSTTASRTPTPPTTRSPGCSARRWRSWWKVSPN